MHKNINLYIYLFFLKDEEAFPILKEIFKPLIYHTIGAFQVHSTDCLWNQSDFFLVADMVLLKCLYYFRIHTRFSFASFYKYSLNNKIRDICRTNRRKSFPWDVEIVHLDYLVSEERSQYAVEKIAAQKFSLHETVVNKLLYDEMIQKLFLELDENAKKVLELWLQVYKRKEICRILNLRVYEVNSVLEKVKNYRVSID